MKQAQPTEQSFCERGKIGVKLAQCFAFVHNGLDDILRFFTQKPTGILFGAFMLDNICWVQ